MENANGKNLKQNFKFASFVLGIILLGCPFSASSQVIDVSIKNGQVIDPQNGISAQMDVAISKGKIFKVAAEIPVRSAKKVIEVKDYMLARV